MRIKNAIAIVALLFAFCFALPTAGAFAQSAQAQTYQGDKFLVNQSFTLKSGDTLTGNLVLIGGALITEDGSLITGDIASMGAALTLAGKVDGDIVSLNGTVNVAASAQVTGNLVATGGKSHISPLATIEGAENTNSIAEQKLDLTNLSNQFSLHHALQNPSGTILWAIFRSLAMAALAAIVVLLFPGPSKNAAGTVHTSAAAGCLVGCLTIFILPFALLLMIVTIILIPAIPLVILIIPIGVIFGYIALGYELAQRIEGMTKSNWAPAVSAGIGVLILSLVLQAISILPCVGFIAAVVVIPISLGVVLLSLFGTRQYPAPPKAFTSSVIPPGNPPSTPDGPEN